MNFEPTPFHISKLKLNNFRCFETLEVSLHPNLTVFVAENGGGKTSVLEGISIALGDLVNALTSVDQRLRSGVGFKDTDFRQHSETDAKERVHTIPADYIQSIITCNLNAKAYNWDAWKPRHAENKPAELKGNIELKELAKEIFERGGRKIVNEGGFQGEFADTYLPALAYYGFNKSIFKIPQRIRGGKLNYGSPFSTYIGCLRSGGDMKEFLTWFDEAESTEFRMNKNAAPDDYDTDRPLQAVRDALESTLSTAEKKFSNPRFEEKPKRFCLDEIQADGEKQELEIAQLSDGYTRMLTIIMDYARRLGLANQFVDLRPLECPGVVLIDEIDIHLHPRWQQRVISDLVRTFPKTQFIITTHSPQVLSTVPAECIRVIHVENGKGWTVTPDAQTEGTESSSVLAAIMGVDALPEIEATNWLNQYYTHIDNGTHETPGAVELWVKLIHHYGTRHNIIKDCERLIRFRTIKNRGNKPDQG